MLHPFRATVLALVVLMSSAVFARADHSRDLGVEVTPFTAGAGGVIITAVDSGSVATMIGLTKGEVILTIGDPNDGFPDALVTSGADLDAALEAFPLVNGVHNARLLTFDPARGFLFSTFSYSLPGDPASVSRLSRETIAEATSLAVAKKPQSKPVGPIEAVHKTKPKTVKQMLAGKGKKYSKGKGKMRLARGKVKRIPTHKPLWFSTGKTAKGKTAKKAK